MKTLLLGTMLLAVIACGTTPTPTSTIKSKPTTYAQTFIKENKKVELPIVNEECPNSKVTRDYKPEWPIENVKESFDIKGPLFEGGKVVCSYSREWRDRTKKVNNRDRIEEGKYNGVKYRFYYADGSGTIQGLPTNTLIGTHDKYSTNWSMSCNFDRMNDTAICSLSRGDIWFSIYGPKKYYVSIGTQHFPPSLIVFRSDKNEPISATAKRGFTSEQEAEIIKQIKTASKVSTRYWKWPYKRDLDETFEPYGFAEGWFILNKIYDNLLVNKNRTPPTR
jgi:hypothetical protein